MRKPRIEIETVYHVFNRGTDQRVMFKDRFDFERFIESMYLFNDEDYSPTGGNVRARLDRLARAEFIEDTRKQLVRIYSFCLLSNHFHLLLEAEHESGISEFLHALEMGYAKFFNNRYGRSGRLVGSSFHAVPVSDESHFQHLPRYIHLNALDASSYLWRDGMVDDWDSVQKFLDEYPWSSHHVYMGQKQTLPIVDEGFVRKMFPEPTEYVAFLRGWSGREIYPDTK